MGSEQTDQVVQGVVAVADGAELAAWRAGPEGGPAVVLVAGAGADHRGWRRIVPELCRSNEERQVWASHGRSLAGRLRVAVFDQAGTGESVTAPPAITAAAIARDAVAVGRALLGERFAVVGESMGGMAALHAALDYPGVVTTLGLIATTAGGSGLTWPTDAFIASAIGPGPPDRDARMRAGAVLWFSEGFPTRQPALFEAIVTDAIDQPTSAEMGEAQMGVLMSHDVASRLGELRVPTLVMCGTEDQAHPLPNSKFLAAGIAGSRLVTVDGVGHLIDAEAPERVIDEIIELVTGSSHPSRAG